jgi:hypothetical protein
MPSRLMTSMPALSWNFVTPASAGSDSSIVSTTVLRGEIACQNGKVLGPPRILHSPLTESGRSHAWGRPGTLLVRLQSHRDLVRCGVSQLRHRHREGA